jgi:hypothetical protein
VQQLVARALKLAASRCDSFCVLDLELDRCLGDHPAGRPRRGAKARLGCLRERPHAEVLAAGDAFTGVVLIGVVLLQRQAEGVNEQLAALRRVSGDDRHARDEENVHMAQATAAARGQRFGTARERMSQWAVSGSRRAPAGIINDGEPPATSTDLAPSTQHRGSSRTAQP